MEKDINQRVNSYIESLKSTNSEIKLKPREILSKNKLIKAIRNSKLSYLGPRALYSLQLLVQSVEQNQVPGIFIEAGCALGGSTILISKNKKLNRKFKVYDVFAQIPPPSERDGDDIHKRYEVINSGNSEGIKGDLYYGYVPDLKLKVMNNLIDFGIDINTHNVELIQGLFENTLEVNEIVAFAHIDCDWYESVKICIEKIYPNLAINGILIIDDYYCWSGCMEAIDEYFAEIESGNYEFFKQANKLVIFKTAL